MKNFTIELLDEDVRKRGLNSVIDFYRTLSSAEISLRDAKGFVTGIDDPFLNVLFDTRDKILNSAEIAEKASIFFNKYHVVWTWFITPAKRENDLDRHGFSLLEESPAMYFSLTNKLPDYSSNSIHIKEVTKDKNLKEWIEPINDGFEVKNGDDSYRLLNESILKSHKDRFRHYVAYYKNKLAGSATLFLTGDSVMLHNLATKEAFRNQGSGTALTIHMMEAAKKLGYEHCYLDSSAKAFNLYKRIGFKTYSSTLIYSKIT